MRPEQQEKKPEQTPKKPAPEQTDREGADTFPKQPDRSIDSKSDYGPANQPSQDPSKDDGWESPELQQDQAGEK